MYREFLLWNAWFGLCLRMVTLIQRVPTICLKDIVEIKESLFKGQWVLKLKTVKLFQEFKLLSGCAFITVLRLENASLKEVWTSHERTAPSAWMVLTTESIILALRLLHVSSPKIARIISHSAISFQIFIQVIYKSLLFNLNSRVDRLTPRLAVQWCTIFLFGIAEISSCFMCFLTMSTCIMLSRIGCQIWSMCYI